MNERIIIAGGSGFLGRVLAKHFRTTGHEVAHPHTTPAFSLSSPEGGEGRGEEASFLRAKIPSPQPSLRFGGEKETGPVSKRVRYEVVILTRTPRNRSDGVLEVAWDGETLGDWTRELEGTAALINLAGRSVNCRYHERNRRLILDSRVNSTRVLGEAIARCAEPPPVWLNSSTATIYKHNFGPAWDESGEIGATTEAKDEFSVEVAAAWERVFNEARTPNTRKVAMRSAMVLGHGRNSVFPVMRNLVRCGLGGKMAGGNQFASWIHETDFCRAVAWLIANDELTQTFHTSHKTPTDCSRRREEADHLRRPFHPPPHVGGYEGCPVNLAAPNPVTNAEMMSTLREVCSMPLGLPASRWMLEIGAFFLRTETELIIKSRRVVSSRLPKSGFQFRFQLFRDAAVDLLNKPA